LLKNNKKEVDQNTLFCYNTNIAKQGHTMNERIAELKAQCIVREQRGTNAFNSYMVDRFDTERFAELIVRECMSNLYLNGYDDAMMQIKQHFGVELC